jgi:hypothetical protein
MNSGLWIFRVTGDAGAANGAGSGSAGSGSGSGGSGGSDRPSPEAAPNPDPAASPPGGPGVLTWAALAGLALGLLAVGAVVRSARRRHP